MADHRRFPRYKPKEQIVAYTEKKGVSRIGKPEMVEYGAVVDISLGGIAVEYLDTSMREEMSVELSLSVFSDSKPTGTLPYKTINDKAICKLPGNRILRRRGFKFENPTRFQREQLATVIQNYTIISSPDNKGRQ